MAVVKFLFHQNIILSYMVLQTRLLCYYFIIIFFCYQASHQQTFIFICNFKHCNAHYLRNKTTLYSNLSFCVRAKIHKK